MTFRYLTPERMQWRCWTRKRRLKFRKRWRKQHNGQKFGWMITEYRYAIKPPSGDDMHVIFFRREDTEKFSPFIKA